jgi:hypothetical protein
MCVLAPTILVAVLVATPAGPLHYENPALHYSLTVPDGWVSMPEDVLETRGNEGGSPAAGAPAPVAAFQRPAKSWFHVPALVITHMPDAGRRPADVFDELSHDSGIGKNGKSVVYDDKRGMVLVPERMPSSDGGEIQRVAVFKPGKLGLLHLDFYLPVGEMPAYMDPTVLQVLDSVRFEPGFEVKDLAPGETLPLGEDLKQAVRKNPTAVMIGLLGLLGLLGGILGSRRKRKM